MSTTAIFAELLVIGIQTGLWVTLLVASLEPTLFRNVDFEGLKEWEVLITAGLFAVCYSLGVLVDRLADLFFLVVPPSLFIKKNSRLYNLQSGLSKLKLKAIPVKLVELAFRESKALEYFDYFRARIRITRALTINAMLTTVAAIVYGLTQLKDAVDMAIFIPSVCAVGGGISVISFLATGMLDLAYETRRSELSRLLDSAGKLNAAAAEPRVRADG